MPPSSPGTIPEGFTRDGVIEALAGAGLSPVGAAELRDARWLAHLTDGRMAWFPADERGRRQLEAERRILLAIAERCAFRAPRVRHVGAGGWDVRDPVAGRVRPGGLYDRLKADAALAARLGAQLGAALGEQHTRLRAGEFAGVLDETVGWPLPDAWVKPRLRGQTQDALLLDRMEAALTAWHRDVEGSPDRVLLHGDLGLHNIAVTDADELAGIFDYGGACLADRSVDFRYFLFDHPHDGLLEAAIAAYEPVAGVRPDRARIALANAASAIGFLAFRDGHGPCEPWCGRTLLQDLAWTEFALDRAGF